MDKPLKEENPVLWQILNSLRDDSAQGRAGWDFSQYSSASMERQLQRLLERYNCQDLSALHYRIETMNQDQRRLLCDRLTVNVTDLFRDPGVFNSLQTSVFPYLAEFPRIKIWLAGCATGEEAYSLAILLAERDLLKRSQILATDLSYRALTSARSGVIKNALSRECASRYRMAGGRVSLLEYFSCQYGVTKLRQELLRHIHFVQHGLPQLPPVDQVQLVLCRNVIIYFKPELKNRALSCLSSSLSPYGYLVLGPKESLEFSPFNKHFTLVAGPQRIYKSNASL